VLPEPLVFKAQLAFKVQPVQEQRVPADYLVRQEQLAQLDLLVPQDRVPQEQVEQPEHKVLLDQVEDQLVPPEQQARMEFKDHRAIQG
jgi:hypothetical protein